MLARLKSGLKSRAALVIDGLQISALALGSSASLAFGKLFAALVFAALAIGIACRFWRRRSAPAAPVVRPLWITLVSGGLAVIGSAAVVEAVNLPVRFDQSGFEKSNWLMIIAMILVFYWILSAILARLSARRVSGTTITTHE